MHQLRTKTCIFQVNQLNGSGAGGHDYGLTKNASFQNYAILYQQTSPHNLASD